VEVLDCLVNAFVASSILLGVPFIAPRQLGVVGGQQGKQFLPSVEWRTGQSSAPPDSHYSCLVHDLLPFSGVDDRCNSRLVGALDSPVPPADR
jgi:hypothetical protein